MQDTYQTKGLRKKLIEELRRKGISNEQVLEAMNNVPRHFFFESAFLSHAYEDKAFPILADQTISQPYTVAFQTQLLEIKKNEKVLEVGTGSGYQASILVEMGAKVYSIERQKTLYQQTKKRMEELHYAVKMFYGDGYAGLPNFAPFDKIIVTCGAPFIPEDLKKQLKIGGYMVIPVGDDTQIMQRIKRVSETEFDVEDYGNFRFVPMLEDRNG